MIVVQLKDKRVDYYDGNTFSYNDNGELYIHKVLHTEACNNVHRNVNFEDFKVCAIYNKEDVDVVYNDEYRLSKEALDQLDYAKYLKLREKFQSE